MTVILAMCDPWRCVCWLMTVKVNIWIVIDLSGSSIRTLAILKGIILYSLYNWTHQDITPCRYVALGRRNHLANLFTHLADYVVRADTTSLQSFFYVLHTEITDPIHNRSSLWSSHIPTALFKATLNQQQINWVPIKCLNFYSFHIMHVRVWV